jgi:hypothetical protein
MFSDCLIKNIMTIVTITTVVGVLISMKFLNKCNCKETKDIK